MHTKQKQDIDKTRLAGKSLIQFKAVELNGP